MSSAAKAIADRPLMVGKRLRHRPLLPNHNHERLNHAKGFATKSHRIYCTTRYGGLRRMALTRLRMCLALALIEFDNCNDMTAFSALHIGPP